MAMVRQLDPLHREYLCIHYTSHGFEKWTIERHACCNVDSNPFSDNLHGYSGLDHVLDAHPYLDRFRDPNFHRTKGFGSWRSFCKNFSDHWRSKFEYDVRGFDLIYQFVAWENEAKQYRECKTT